MRRVAKRMLRRLLVGLILLAAQPAGAAELIKRFDSVVRIAPDGSMQVTETILVNAEGREIKRGIYRDFPTRYDTLLGRRLTPFQVLEVRRDGAPENHRFQERENGMRVYLGRADRVLPTGEHEYVIRYRTDRQLGFFEGHDELYWNVTGNDWAFPIVAAAVTVILPRPVPSAEFRLDGYTGSQGATRRDWRSRFDADGNPVLEITDPLLARHGFTVAVGFPKGIVAEPTREQRLARWAGDNPEWRAGAIGLAAVLGYYLLVWHLFGRDPKTGVIIPRFEPPRDISPADARYLDRMSFDDGAFAAALVSLAVKGYLRIDEDRDGDYTLRRRSDAAAAGISNDEQALLSALALGNEGSLALMPSSAKVVKAARSALKRELKKEHVKRHFVTNGPYLVPGVLVSIGILAWAASGSPENAPAGLFMLVWLTGWSVATFGLLAGAWRAWRAVGRGTGSRLGRIATAAGLTLFALPFAGFEVMGLAMLAKAGSVLVVLLLVLLAAINWLFYEWLKAPTRMGRWIRDELDGFRMYLGVAEKDRLNLLNPPERTPELFEKYLPYAIALGVEHEWAAQFEQVLAAAAAHDGAARSRWYHSPSSARTGFGSLAGGLAGGLSGAIASASSPPGSGSGGGGGGSSGGGGGGGGGGGW